jgi:hypothetical protein
MTSEPHPTPALEAAARLRREIREALVAFEGALASPIGDRVTWHAEVTDALEVLGHAFEDHVAATEARGGLYDEMRDTAPHLGTKSGRLREEHPAITAALIEASVRLAALATNAADADAADADAARDELQRLMGRIVRHRQHGADLVWEAYAIDIGDIGDAG